MDLWRGRCARTAGAGARCTSRLRTQHSFLPGRSPKLATLMERARILPAACIHRPAAQRLLPPLRTPIVPAPPVLPQRASCWATVSPRAAALLKLEHPAPRPQPVVITSREKAGLHPGSTHSGGKPPQSMRGRDSHGAFDFAKRLECARLRALSKHRTAAGDLLPHFCFPQTTRLSEDPTPHTVGGTSPTPARGWVYPNRRPRPQDRKALLAELLPPAAAEVAGGRPKTQTRPRVGSFASRGCNSLSEQRFTFGRLVPVRAARTLKGNGFFVGFPVAGAQKVKCAADGLVWRS